MPCRTSGFRVSDASGFRVRASFRRRRPRGRKPVGDTVCEPQVAVRKYRNSEAAARVQAGRLPDRTGAGIPDRSDIRTRHDRTVRSARFPIRANGKPRRAAIPATRRKTREKKQDEFPGRQNRKCGRGERPERLRVRFGFAESGSEESSCDRSSGRAGRPFPAETLDESETSAKHFSTPKPKI